MLARSFLGRIAARPIAPAPSGAKFIPKSSLAKPLARSYTSGNNTSFVASWYHLSPSSQWSIEARRSSLLSDGAGTHSPLRRSLTMLICVPNDLSNPFPCFIIHSSLIGSSKLRSCNCRPYCTSSRARRVTQHSGSYKYS